MNKTQIFKKTKWLAVCLSVLLVAGCSRVTIDADLIKRGEELCKEHKGLASVDKLHDWVQPNLTCKDGVKFEFYGDRLEKHEPKNESK